MSYPWFKCYPDDFLGGLADLSTDEQAFYVQLVFRMYDAADAIYVDDKRIARWCNSNVRKWNRVKAALIEAGKLTELPDGGLINRRALAEMLKNSDRVPEKIRDRLANLSQMFEQTLGKDSQKFRETSEKKPEKTDAVKDTRCEKTEHAGEKIDPLKVRQLCMKAAGLTEADIAASPGIVSTVQIYNLLYPQVGEPCDLERDVLPAVEACAAKLRARQSKLRSWGYCHDAIIENRDRRLAGVPNVKLRPTGSAAGSNGRSSNPALNALISIQEAARGADDHGGVQADDTFTIDHEELVPARYG